MLHWKNVTEFLLIVASVLAIVSMVAPAVEGTVAFVLLFLPVDRTPTIVLLIAGLLGLIRVPWSPYPWLLTAGPSTLLATPWLFGTEPRPPGWLRRTAAAFLLAPWLVLAARDFFLTPLEREQWGWDHVYRGYHLFCIAHTLAFIAAQIAPWSRRADKQLSFTLPLRGSVLGSLRPLRRGTCLWTRIPW